MVQRNYLKESANTQDQQISSLCSSVCFPYYSATEILHDSQFAMLLTLLPTFVMHWCPAVLIRCLLNKCRDQLRNFSMSSTALSVS